MVDLGGGGGSTEVGFKGGLATFAVVALAMGEGVLAGLAGGVGVRERWLGLLLKKLFLSLSNSSTSLGVGVSSFFVARISLSARSAAFSVRGINSIIEMTLVNKRCSESDRVVLGFRNLYISAADLARAAPGMAGFWFAAWFETFLDAMCETRRRYAGRVRVGGVM